MNGSAIEGRTCRAARAFLNWSTRRLATRSGVSVRVILDLERDRGAPNGDLLRLEHTFRDAGLLVLAQGERGIGVRLASVCAEDTNARIVAPHAWLPYGSAGLTCIDTST